MPEAYEQWVDAQLFSERAAQITENWKNIIEPLERARKKDVLQMMWRVINSVRIITTPANNFLIQPSLLQNYQSTCNKDIDTLWGLESAFDRPPRWSPYRPKLDFSDSDSELDSDTPPGLVPVKGARRKGSNKDRLAITDGADHESDGSMPSLRSVSDSSANSEDLEESDEEEESEDEDEDEDEEYDYDSDDEVEMKKMLGEAMDIAAGVPGIFDPRVAESELEAIPEERKDNPFLKLLGSLRGPIYLFSLLRDPC